MSDHILVEARLELVVGWRSVVRMVGVRNALKVSELNSSVKDRAYYQSLSKNMNCGVEGTSRVWRRSGKSS